MRVLRHLFDICSSAVERHSNHFRTSLESALNLSGICLDFVSKMSRTAVEAHPKRTRINCRFSRRSTKKKRVFSEFFEQKLNFPEETRWKRIFLFSGQNKGLCFIFAPKLNTIIVSPEILFQMALFWPEIAK